MSNYLKNPNVPIYIIVKNNNYMRLTYLKNKFMINKGN